MFLVSLLLPASESSFLGCVVHEHTFFFPLLDRKNNNVKLISDALYLKSIECFLLPFRKLFLGSAVSKLLAASIAKQKFH